MQNFFQKVITVANSINIINILLFIYFVFIFNE